MRFTSEVENIFTQKEIEEILKYEQQFFIDHAEKNWLNRYFKISAMAKETQVPSVVSSISDMPKGSGTFNKSKTESFALQSVRAREWVETLFKAVESLNPCEQELIELKYLQKRNDGAKYSDEVIYPQLFMGKNKYYRMKREALEILGRKLYGVITEGDCS
ncbi:hypothetical protein CFK37_03940 [Virgibacillus phasianinus]|uniref:ArpU family transcriptional regulator n=1 Tax=Virgibacillus phasianinus TaxID=2017483 RepID=A0A220U0D9_9BACI|nr:ArpU family phage packaging/lysis transcriptional regulator [Virgibacillus phasianinus]ASK61383.1 hypothetical protein CFK37_03940 [Virgibacillus phasianinus]